MLTHPKVLVIGINQLLVWNVTRSLAREQIKPVILSSQPFAPVKFSTSCKKYICWKNVELHDGELDSTLLVQVEQICKQEKIDIAIPADYESTLLLSTNKNNINIPVCIVPEAETMRQLHNKWELSRLLNKMNLPYPASEYIESAESLLATKLPFPMITKPLAQWASVGFEVHQSFEELKSKVLANKLSSAYPLIAQAYVPGWDGGVYFLADKGELVAYCVYESKQKRRRTFIEDKRLIGYIAELVKATKYSGVGCWDTRYNPETDEYKILELNPRFGASLLYASNAGLNYPLLVANPTLWNKSKPRLARLGAAIPTFYERAMSFATRLSNKVYDNIK